METKTKKITLATVKSFIKKNFDNLYILTESRFDGMSDMVESIKGASFIKATVTPDHKDNTLGVEGAWIVGQSRDYFTAYNKDGFTGYHVYNCCGSFTIAVMEEAKAEVATAESVQPVAPAAAGEVQIVDYSEKAFAVIGDTKPVKEVLKAAGGKFNPYLKCGAGWIFSKKRMQEVTAALQAA